ncbi:30S ribosomal protein S2 [Candidatus Dojkabacteria bacterium]|nr:30S ribosomal protein S2 [Candidatus Dojkabacteria bacterium]
MAISNKSSSALAKTAASSSSKSAKQDDPGFKVSIPSLQDLLEAGAHFGHKTSRWNPKMKKYIFDTRSGIHIIDLTQTINLLEDAVRFLHKASKQGNILLVGTKGQAATLIKNSGADHGAFYISRRWPGGLLTNYKNIRRSVKRLIEIEENLASHKGYETKKERMVMEKDRDRLSKLYEGVRFMDKEPAAMVVIDTRVEKNAIKEAKKRGIKVAGLIDTNCDPNLVDYPIPANDDALKSIRLFVETLVHGFSGSDTSARLIGLRNDHAAKLADLEAKAVAEEERIKREKELEVQRLKAMKEGKVVETGRTDTKVFRIVKKEDQENAEEKETTKELSNAETKVETKVKKAQSKVAKKEVKPSKTSKKKVTPKTKKTKKTVSKKTTKKSTKKPSRETTKKTTKKTTKRKSTKKTPVKKTRSKSSKKTSKSKK